MINDISKAADRYDSLILKLILLFNKNLYHLLGQIPHSFVVVVARCPR